MRVTKFKRNYNQVLILSGCFTEGNQTITMPVTLPPLHLYYVFTRHWQHLLTHNWIFPAYWLCILSLSMHPDLASSQRQKLSEVFYGCDSKLLHCWKWQTSFFQYIFFQSINQSINQGQLICQAEKKKFLVHFVGWPCTYNSCQVSFRFIQPDRIQPFQLASSSYVPMD